MNSAIFAHRFLPLTVASFSSHEERHNSKHSKHDVIDRSRHRISGCEVLSYRDAAKPEHKPEFRDEQESERGATHSESGRRHGRDCEMPNYLACCHNRDHKHDGGFHQLGHPRADIRDDP